MASVIVVDGATATLDGVPVPADPPADSYRAAVALVARSAHQPVAATLVRAGITSGILIHPSGRVDLLDAAPDRMTESCPAPALAGTPRRGAGPMQGGTRRAGTILLAATAALFLATVAFVTLTLLSRPAPDRPAETPTPTSTSPTDHTSDTAPASAGQTGAQTVTTVYRTLPARTVTVTAKVPTKAPQRPR